MKDTIGKIFIALSFTMMLIGCMTEKKAVKQIAKISHKQPEVLASECGKRYPPIDSIWEKETFIEGETMVVVDTLMVDCPEYFTKGTNVQVVPVRKVKIPIANKLRVDTIRVDKFERQHNEALLQACNLEKEWIKENDRLTINKLENEAIEQAHGKKVWMIIALVLAAVFIIGFVWKWLKKKFTFNIF